MSVDVLVAVADDALRAVLEIALVADGCTVRTAGDRDAAIEALAVEPAQILLLDATAPFADDLLSVARHRLPAMPTILLIPAWEYRLSVVRPGTVTVQMPFGREELRRALAAAQGHSRGEAAPARILLVDDDQAICEVVAALLNARDYVVTTCATPTEAAARLGTESFDLVLADGLSQQPDVAWTTAAEILRLAGSTPVVLFTAHEFDPEAVLALGYREYIQKPFDIEDVERRIRAVLASEPRGIYLRGG